jgi:hypothetical protein
MSHAPRSATEKGATSRRGLASIVVVVLALAGAWLAFDRAQRDGAAPRLARPASGAAPREDSGSDTSGALPTAVDSPGLPLLQPERRERELPFASGYVVDEANRPLEGVAIVARPLRTRRFSVEARLLFDDELDARIIARSDTHGRFEVGELPSRTASLLLVAAGRAPAEWRELSADRAANQGQLFTLTRARTLEGVVRDADGATIGHAVVTWRAKLTRREWLVLDHLEGEPLCGIEAAEACLVAAGDERGRFGFARLPAGRGEVTARAKGYEEITVDEEELAAAGGALVLERDAFLFEAVAAEDGRPLDDATAVVVDPKTQLPIAWLPEPVEEDDEDFAERLAAPARLCWRGVAPAAAGVATEVASALAATFAVTVVAPGRRARTIEVATAHEGEPPRFVVPLEIGRDEPSLTGRIVGAATATIELRVALPERMDHPLERRTPLATTRSDAAHDFEFRGLPPCRVRLDAVADGCALLRRDVELPLHGLVLEFAPEARLETLVLDRRDQPVAGVVVIVQSVPQRRAWQATSGADGRCHFAALASDRWQVGVFPRRNASAEFSGSSPLVDASTFRPEEAVELSAGETRALVVRLPEPAPCRITIVDDRGAPLHDVPLAIEPVESTGWLARIDGTIGRAGLRDVRSIDGRFDVELVPGRYIATAGEGARVVWQRFEVEPMRGGAVTLVVPMNVALARIEGRLVERGSGRPLAGGSVRLQRESRSPFDSFEFAFALSDIDGAFSFDEILAGRVTLTAHGPEIQSHDPMQWSYNDWFTTTITVDATADAPTHVELPLVRREVAEDAAISLRVQLRDHASGARLIEGSVTLCGHVGRAIVQLGTIECDGEGVVALRIPRVERCFASAAAPRFTREPVTHLVENVELPIVAGAIDAVLELDAVKER